MISPEKERRELIRLCRPHVLVVVLEFQRELDGRLVGVNNNSVSDDASLALKVEMVIRASALIAVAQNAG